jgi:hypothetical protein
MGSGTFTTQDWTRYARSNVYGKSTNEIYTSKGLKTEFDPKNVLRESRDSDEHPNSTPIIIGLDVTGSMNNILYEVAQQLGSLVTEILERKPVSDPQIMFNAIGDSYCDEVPFQCTQFESDIRIAEQLTQLYFERGGGGNDLESYPLVWYFAANHTSCDNFEKRGKKGFLFTMGDDAYPKTLTSRELSNIFGDKIEGASELTMNEVLTQTSREWEIFHLCLKQGSNMSSSWYADGGTEETNRVLDEWTNLIGERAIPVSDYTKIPQIIVSILERMAGKSVEDIVDSWDGSTAVAVKEAISGLAETKERSDLIEF